MRLLLIMLLPLLLMTVPGFATERHCERHPDILVAARQLETVSEVCRAAEEALVFLAQYGLEPQRPIRLSIIDTSIRSQGYEAYGSYDSRSDTIELMSYRSILAGSDKPEMYGEPFDRVHYAGAIAHEVAHAVMQHNLMTELISPAPQEYLAHATQLAVLPQARREAIISNLEVGPWEAGDAISDIYMAMQPGRFAVKSYLHLTSTDDPVGFVKILLNANWFYVYVP